MTDPRHVQLLADAAAQVVQNHRQVPQHVSWDGFRRARRAGRVLRMVGRLRTLFPLRVSESTHVVHRLDIYGRWPRRIP